MFFGEFKHSMDEKCRIRIPAKLKQQLGLEFVITKGTNSCLFVFPKNYFEQEFLAKLNSVPTFSSGQKPIRMLLSSSFQPEEDAQGRFVLPQNLKEHAKILKNLIIIGVGNRIEIWSEEVWNEYKGNDDFDNIAEILGSYNV